MATEASIRAEASKSWTDFDMALPLDSTDHSPRYWPNWPLRNSEIPHDERDWPGIPGTGEISQPVFEQEHIANEEQIVYVFLTPDNAGNWPAIICPFGESPP